MAGMHEEAFYFAATIDCDSCKVDRWRRDNDVIMSIHKHTAIHIRTHERAQSSADTHARVSKRTSKKNRRAREKVRKYRIASLIVVDETTTNFWGRLSFTVCMSVAVSVSSGSIHHAIDAIHTTYAISYHIFGRYSSQFYSIHQTLWLVCRCLHSIGFIDFGPSIFSLRRRYL